MIKKLIRCTACNQIIPNYESHELTRAKSLPGVEWSNADLVIGKKFLRLHSGHRLEELLVEENSWVSQKPSYEPLGESYFFASNTERKFLIRRTKAALDRPAFYEILPGRLKVSNVSLKIQENDLRKQISVEERFSPLLKERMERFIQVFRDETDEISPEKIEEEAEEIEEGECSTLAYVGLTDSRWTSILNRVACILLILNCRHSEDSLRRTAILLTFCPSWWKGRFRLSLQRKQKPLGPSKREGN